MSAGDISANNAKMYPCNSTTQKAAGYNYIIQHGGSKNVCTASNSHFNSGPQRSNFILFFLYFNTNLCHIQSVIKYY